MIEHLTLQTWGFGQCRIIDIGDTQGFVATTDRVALIAFRGSESLGDWIGNLDLFMTSRTYGCVHSGFLAAFEPARDVLLSTLAMPAGGPPRKTWLTGHSLGGALALLTAAELGAKISVSGLHTFGQPRVGDAAMGAHMTSEFGDRHMRFVNDADIITRLPPGGYQHSGRLVHFDADGQVRQASGESASRALESPPVTDAEFDRLKSEIKRIQGQLVQHGRSPTESALDRSIEGLFPGFGDHRLDRYVAAIRRHVDGGVAEAGLEFAKARSAGPVDVSAEGGNGGGTGADTVPVLLRLKSAAWFAPNGLEIGTRIGQILSANASPTMIRQLENDPNVVSVEISSQTARRDLATSTSFVGATTVHRPPVDERGDSALIGIIDDGIDVLHETFLDAQGRSRILAVWDQQDPTGPSPHTLDPIAFPAATRFGAEGTVHLARRIQDYIEGVVPVPKALRNDDAHGTHVASIAAGRALPTSALLVATAGGVAAPSSNPVAMADGMAPDAKLVVVIPKLRPNPGDPWSVGYSAGHMAALDFLAWAHKGGNVVSAQALPMAINVSMGMNAGAHDGQSGLETAFDVITKKGTLPGLVVIKSAGNERGHGGHTRIVAFNGLLPVQWMSMNRMRFRDYMEAWYAADDDLEFTLVDPALHSSGVVSVRSPSTLVDLGGNLCELTLTERHPENGDNRLVITITPKTAAIQPGLWTLNVRGVSILSRSGILDIWVERDDGTRAVRFEQETVEGTLSIPGTADTVITVAAANSREPLELTRTSSWGPTRKGKIAKPELCAPGTAIIAASAGTNDHRATRPETGTSMAAPHVTGALALVMSHRHKQTGKSQFTAQTLRSLLISSARFGGFAHPGFGHGTLDASRLFDLAK
jgi:endonuclease G